MGRTQNDFKNYNVDHKHLRNPSKKTNEQAMDDTVELDSLRQKSR